MDLSKIAIGASETTRLTVGPNDTAIAMGSGSLEVLATPTLIAIMENAAMNTIATNLPEGITTVGVKMDMEHLRPSALGTEVCAKADLVAIEGKRFTFSIEAKQGEEIIGVATHIRVAVDAEKFLSRLKGE